MPAKHDQFSTPSQKILGLFGMLLFTGNKYSLTRLAKIQNCSKQTVLRMMEQIELSREIKLESWKEDGKRWYRIKAPRAKPCISVAPEDIQRLVLCKDMVFHLLPREMRREIEQTLSRSTVLLPDMDNRHRALASFSGSKTKGTIDYTPFNSVMETLFKAIEGDLVCSVSYQAAKNPEPKSYDFAPRKIVNYRDALYALGSILDENGNQAKGHETTLAIHRFKKVELADKTFKHNQEDPDDAKHFGFMKQESFTARIKFSPDVAAYVCERTWSEDQKVKKQKNGKVVLEFTAQSRPELVSWILSFGPHAQVMQPRELKEEIADIASRILAKYSN